MKAKIFVSSILPLTVSGTFRIYFTVSKRWVRSCSRSQHKCEPLVSSCQVNSTVLCIYFFVLLCYYRLIFPTIIVSKFKTGKSHSKIYLWTKWVYERCNTFFIVFFFIYIYSFYIISSSSSYITISVILTEFITGFVFIFITFIVTHIWPRK